MNTLRLPAKIESLEPFRSFVLEKIAKETSLGDITDRVDLVLEEILVNVISYAYEDEGTIELECVTGDAERFQLIVKDWGAAFNPLDRPAPTPTEDISDMQVGGWGIVLVRNMANDVRYERRDGANILTMVFEREAG